MIKVLKFFTLNLHLTMIFIFHAGTEDVNVAECLRRLGVYPEKSIDDEGRERFHSLSIKANLKGDFPEWYRRYAANPLKTVNLFLFELK